MNLDTLAQRLIEADVVEQAVLIDEHATSVGPTLIRVLKAEFDRAESSDPQRAQAVAAAVTVVAQRTADREVRALAAWIAGMAARLNGALETSLPLHDAAAQLFGELEQPVTAAQTQVSKLISLAILGRYDEAILAGLGARDIFAAHGDLLQAGKIEQNLGNIYFRRGSFRDAERWYRAARDRFQALDDPKQLAQIDNVLGLALTEQHRFGEAAPLYAQALQRAEQSGLVVTQAEIACNLGYLALFQGTYDDALHYLERSRRHYATFDLPHELATVELELADAYLALNLAPEAAALYERVIPQFAQLEMRAEQARASANHGRALVILQQFDQAQTVLAQAKGLYAVEGNAVGAALVMLVQAQLLFQQKQPADAAVWAKQAEQPLIDVGAWSQVFVARWLQAEVARVLGDWQTAHGLLEQTLAAAAQGIAPGIVERCYTSLGLLAVAEENTEAAIQAFRRAVDVIEQLRAPLPAASFRIAFVADKLTPYLELARLALQRDAVGEALEWFERARGRALVESIGHNTATPQPRDAFEHGLTERMLALREELNWFYAQINRQPDADPSAGEPSLPTLYAAAREREARLLELERQWAQHGSQRIQQAAPFDLLALQRDLGTGTALVEYASLDGQLLAFVITGEGVRVVTDLGSEAEVEERLEQLRFQIDAFRWGAQRLRPHLPQLTQRVQRPLAALFDQLIRPLLPQLQQRRLVVVPYRALHYVPFHALYDGDRYLIERYEIAYAPSATVLQHCWAQPHRPHERALLLGVPDLHMPLVRDEVLAVAPLFSQPVVLVDAAATINALQREAPGADIVHLACHGQFRPDNPLFSSLRLADGWLTVQDAATLNLQANLVVLSACETGISGVAPGDELIGLARGFLGAGAPSLMVSLWAVDDASTAHLMTHFYKELVAGSTPAAALRAAQRQLLTTEPHPYFWAPFILLGRP